MIWFSGQGGIQSKVGLSDLEGLFQPSWLCRCGKRRESRGGKEGKACKGLAFSSLTPLTLVGVL